MSRDSPNIVKQAIEFYQHSSGSVDNRTMKIIEKEFNYIWSAIQRQPDSYTMNDTEFKVFNQYYNNLKPELQQKPAARTALKRYWNNRRGWWSPTD